jgi:hypothetical protein
MLELFVNDTNPVDGIQPAAGAVNDASGLALTKIVWVIESLHPPVDVNTYLITCVPAPAVAGLKFPAASVPGPL